MVIVASSVNQLVSQSLIVIEILAHTDVMEELDIRYIYHLAATATRGDRPGSFHSVPLTDCADSVPSCRFDGRMKMPHYSFDCGSLVLHPTRFGNLLLPYQRLVSGPAVTYPAVTSAPVDQPLVEDLMSFLGMIR